MSNENLIFEINISINMNSFKKGFIHSYPSKSQLTSKDFKSNFLLVDNIQKLDDLSDYVSKQIITFDYSSHIFLNEQKISHITSDDFHSDVELQKIENLIYSFVKWYDLPSIKNMIFENDINLGELFFFEFRDELRLFLKKYIEISNIIKSNLDSHYFVSDDISEILSIFTKNFTKLIIKNHEILIHDLIDVPLNLGSKQFTVKLSTKNISRIQTFLNKITQSLFLKKQINQKFSSILIVNFSTIKTKEFLLKIPNFNLNVIKYDRTNPTIWNKHSLNIIKNSGCIVENDSTLSDTSSLEKIKQKKQIFLSNLDSLLLSKDIEKHFSLNQISFWNAIKPLFTRLCNKRFLQAAKELELAKNLLKKYHFSKILLLHESGMVEQIILKLAKQQKIPVHVLQHGLYYDSDEMTPENNFQRLMAKNSDYFITWGNYYKNYLLKNKVDPHKIKVLGSIFSDELFQKNTPDISTGSILLASDPKAFYRLTDLTIDQKELYKIL